MCGFFGCVSSNNLINKELALNSLSTIDHRGPDSTNYYHKENFFSGFNRLSINDLSSSGNQPMINYNEDCLITVNGEVYNFKTLKEELSAKYTFKSNSDSEVILHGYLEWGIDGLLERIEGMYAGMIYDIKKRTILLFRDRVGIKPLYYSDSSMFLWSSELNPIVKYLNLGQSDYNNEALYDFLTYRYVPSPKTLYKKISKLEPGHYIKYDLKNQLIKKIKYWGLTKKKGYDFNLKNIEENINHSIENHLSNSDVEISLSLSGGIDSNILAFYLSNQNKNFKAFHLNLKNHNDESDLVEEISKNNNFSLITETSPITSEKDFFQLSRKLYTEPLLYTSSVSGYQINRLVNKNGIKILLTGDGGDEIFNGYRYYYWFIRNLKLRDYKGVLKIPNYLLQLIGKNSNTIQNLDLTDLELITKLKGGLLKNEKTYFKEKLLIPIDYDDYWFYRKFYNKELPVSKRFQYLDFHTFLPEVSLTKVDRTSMINSIECRVPFLSTKLIESSFWMSNKNFLYKNLKWPLKEIYKNKISTKILNNSKKGFSPRVNTNSSNSNAELMINYLKTYIT